MTAKQDPPDPLEKLSVYGSVWWWTTLLPWLLVVCFDLSIFMKPFRGMPRFVQHQLISLGMGDTSTLILLDACHHLRLLSPLIGWAAARAMVRRASIPHRSGAWILTARAPWWALSISLCGVLATMLTWVMVSGLPYVGILTIPAGLFVRIALEVFWFSRCFRDASCIAVLEKTGVPAPEKAFRLQRLEGPSKPVTVREYDDYSSSVYLMEGDSEVLWKAIGSIETLGVELKAPATGKTGRTADV